MRIVVRATEKQKEEWQQKNISPRAEIEFVEEIDEVSRDVFFDLAFNENNPQFIATDRPVFVNAVTMTLKELPENYIRINAWSGFLKRNILEIAADDVNKERIKNIMNILNCEYALVPDIVGMISARIITMIINEAYYALGDKVSSKEDIDIAMKLGTNYPYGPFEWGKKIGLNNIYRLLKKMGDTESRYTLAPLLIEEALNTTHKL